MGLLSSELHVSDIIAGRSDSARAGLAYMVISCFLFAGVSAFVFEAHSYEPTASVFVSSFIRIVVNLFVIMAMIVPKKGIDYLAGDSRPSLWLRGLFGTLSLFCSFSSIVAIGIGE